MEKSNKGNGSKTDRWIEEMLREQRTGEEMVRVEESQQSLRVVESYA